LKLLLDTHIWLWSLGDPSRLGRRVQEQFSNQTNEFWLSPVSLWEALTLHRKGRILLKGNLAAWVHDATCRFREAPLTQEIALVAAQLPLEHSDPADRFIAATAQIFQLTLVTADQRLLGLGEVLTLANR